MLQPIDAGRIETAVTFFNEHSPRCCDLNNSLDENVQEVVMRNRAIVFAMGFVVTLTGAVTESSAQVQAVQSRSPQQVVINGQIVNGAYVTAAGGQIQSFTCAMPQQYTTPDG